MNGLFASFAPFRGGCHMCAWRYRVAPRSGPWRAWELLEYVGGVLLVTGVRVRERYFLIPGVNTSSLYHALR